MTLNQFKNSILKRIEIEYIVEAPQNPGFQKATEMVSDKLKAPSENIAIKAVRGNFGKNQFLIEAFVYESASDKERIEPKKKEKKKVEGQ
ncbi:hypothetical protein FJZ18_04795 [Candidatus Pacearchaeota archaeon]|nr:hypothetical protein [Candidatus Pacearchaeota archaeon]